MSKGDVTRPDAGSSIRPLLAGICALAIAMGVGRFAYTALLPDMQRAVGFGTDAAGWLASVNYAGYLLGALAVAAFPPGGPKGAAVRALLVASIATTAAMALTSAFPAWAALRFASGAVSAGILVLASDLVLDALRRRGHQDWLGVHFAGVGAGIALTGLVAAVPGGTVDWRGGWVGLAALCAMLLPVCWAWLPRAAADRAAPDAPPQPPRAGGFPLVVLIAAYFCEGAGYIVTGTFLVAIVKATPGLDSLAAFAWVMVGVAAAPSAIVWGRVAVRLGAPATLVLAHLVQAVGIVLPAWSQTAAAVLAAAVLFGSTFIGITVVAVSFAGRLAANPGGAIGLLTAGFGVGQIIGPIAAGRLAAGGRGFDAALVAAAATVGVGALLLVAGRLRAGARS